ncbi:hypothetical protein LZS85_15510 [Aliivibrio fischeri]|uniref:hypothetical protein n=1 Tax=Aliivibrio fischeri TaxID=668 RepID=UPI001F3E01EB|nr:hypothetical protein [Aliivibrio fischeri]MCE7567530.1 hypothetical protein [Aliivibrio fischeri]
MPDVAKRDFSGEFRRHVIRVINYIGNVDNIPDLKDEIVNALDNEDAFLFAKGDKDDDAFFVLQPLVVDDKPAVNVLFAYCPDNNALKTYFPVIEALSKEIGAVLLTGYTRHEKIFAICESLGFIRTGKTNQDLIKFYKPIE